MNAYQRRKADRELLRFFRKAHERRMRELDRLDAQHRDVMEMFRREKKTPPRPVASS